MSCCYSPAFPVEKLATFIEIILIYLATHIIDTHLVGRYTACLRAHHRVENRLAILQEISVNPSVQLLRLLCGMEFSAMVIT